MPARGKSCGTRMASTEPLDPFAEIDRLACGGGFAPEETAARARALQAAARLGAPNVPLSRAITELLLARRRDHVGLFTGFVLPDVLPCGENDGPLGTVALARALDRAGFAVTIHADPQAVDHTTWLAAEISADVPVESIPTGSHAALAKRIDLAIAIEKPGENAEGHLHAWNGRRIEGGSISIDALFRRMAAAGKPTVAIGDRGNEIGFGAIRDALLTLAPEVRRCTCGCGGGTAAITAADVLFPAAVSNWGAYALGAALAVANEDRSLLLLPQEEERLLNVAAVRGCRDGLLRTAAFGVDGISGIASIHVVSALCAVVESVLGAK